MLFMIQPIFHKKNGTPLSCPKGRLRVCQLITKLTYEHVSTMCFIQSQYEMILDIVNNLLLFVDSKQKEREERQQRLKFKLHLNSINDQKTPIVHRQNQLRALVSRVRQLERETYLIQREEQEGEGEVHWLIRVTCF